jgi:uncharacterized protein (TIGR04255 family)
MKFAKPPLVELIAELRWGTPVVAIPAGGQFVPVIGGVTNRHEEFFMRFGAKVAGDGFDRFERIVPAGFPLMPFQAVYRYRYGAPDKGTALYQLGPGLFTANITPPYDNWEKFRPVVEKGVAYLLECRAKEDEATPFGSVSLRYIDSFRPELTGGVRTIDFLRDVLGFSITPPAVILELAGPDAIATPAVQFQIALPNKLQIELQAGDGQVNGEQTVILNTVVATTEAVNPSVESAMAAYDAAHTVIRTAFLGMTGKIANLMQPVAE